MTLHFNDGVKIDTSGKLRPALIKGEWYVVGNGMLIPVLNFEEALETIADLNKKDQS